MKNVDAEAHRRLCIGPNGVQNYQLLTGALNRAVVLLTGAPNPIAKTNQVADEARSEGPQASLACCEGPTACSTSASDEGGDGGEGDGGESDGGDGGEAHAVARPPLAN